MLIAAMRKIVLHTLPAVVSSRSAVFYVLQSGFAFCATERSQVTQPDLFGFVGPL